MKEKINEMIKKVQGQTKGMLVWNERQDRGQCEATRLVQSNSDGWDSERVLKLF